MKNVVPVTLAGRIVRLEPLSMSHLGGLCAVGLDESIWKLMPYTPVTSRERMVAQIEDLLGRQARGTDLPFTVILQATGAPVGMTRYLDIQPANQALEVGGTWYGVAYQRTGVNTESKFLILRHAFETLEAMRVQIKTDLRNIRSQRAIERIGAVREGVLREHMLLPDGTRRSSVYFSILVAEWPAVKQRLIDLMDRPAGQW